MSGGWGLSLRLAGRDVGRRPGRTALVVAAIGLPVAGLMTALTIVRTATESPEQARAAVYGHADAVAGIGLDDFEVYSFAGMDPATDVAAATADLQASLPDGSTLATVMTTPDGAVGPDGHLRLVDLSDEDLDDPLLAGRYDVLSGRAPTNEREAAVPVDLAGDLDLATGDELELLRRGTVEVTGIVAAADRSDMGRPIIVGGDLPPTSVPPGAVGAPSMSSTTLRWFVDLPGDDVVPRDLPEIAVGSWWPPFEQSDLVADLRTQLAISYAVAGIVLIVAGFVAVAAFAVGARRQLRTFGVLAAGGVPPSGLRRIAVLQGAVTGFVASAVGVGVAIAVCVIVVEPRLAGWIDRAVGPLEIAPLDLVGAIVVGTVTATVAAALPARTAARVPVLSAMAGRRPLGRVPVRVPLAGLALAVMGFVAVAGSGMVGGQSTGTWQLAVGGVAAVLVGGALMAPLIVGWLEPLAGRLHGSARLAARDLARHRVRTGAAAAAVLAPAAVAVFALTLVASRQADNPSHLRTDQVVATPHIEESGLAPVDDALRASVREVLPGATEAEIRTVGASTPLGASLLHVSWDSDGDGHDWSTSAEHSAVAVASPALLEALAAPQEVAELVADDETIVALADVPDEVVIDMNGEGGVPHDLVTREAIRVVDTNASDAHPRLLVSDGWVTQRGLTTTDDGVVWRSSEPLTDAQQDALRPGTGSAERDAWVRHAVLGEPAPPPRPWIRYEDPAAPDTSVAAAVAGGMLAFTLAVVAVTIALTRAESRDEDALLAAVGVPPSTQRGVAAWQAVLVPAVGVAIGVVLGLPGAWATLRADSVSDRTPFALPWVGLILLVAVPLVSGLITRAVATLARRRPMARRQAFAWD